jgi:hypothetical protein
MAIKIDGTERAREILRECDPGLLYVNGDVDEYIEESVHENGDDWFKQFADSEALIEDFGEYLEATA